jgi:UDP-N-acetylmuramate dehydrogenase
MDVKQNITLAPYTTFKVGGTAEKLISTSSAITLVELSPEQLAKCTVLGYGANVLISDHGLPGLIVIINENPDDIFIEDDGTVRVDAGHSWDALVKASVEQDWWGLELSSGIPGGIGAAVVGNIAAYGQAVKDTLVSIEALDRTTGEQRTLTADKLDLNYRTSNLQTTNQHLIVLEATFQLNPTQTTELSYQSALDVAEELRLSPETLSGRRQIIIETRRRAGSLLDNDVKTAGSFFRNPLISSDRAEELMQYDETRKTAQQIKKMNRVHGGNDMRVSAAHVLLAAGFERGQSWGSVRLHPDHVLKIENTGGATAQEIHNVARHIQQTAKSKLDINIEPEVKFLGKFDI